MTCVSLHTRQCMHQIRVAEHLGVRLPASPPPCEASVDWHEYLSTVESKGAEYANTSGSHLPVLGTSECQIHGAVEAIADLRIHLLKEKMGKSTKKASVADAVHVPTVVPSSAANTATERHLPEIP